MLTALRNRTLQLQAAAEISSAASSILNLDELLPMAVELIRDRFGLYYTGIFLLDEDGDSGRYAVLKAGTGQAGRQMVAQGHKLAIGGDSMVGWCVANAQARIAQDVGEEAIRFDNPLLPHTRSEMALPLISRGRVIGAMTIQSAQAAAFAREDVSVLQTMADHLANAIENARLFQERERRITDLAIVNEIGQAVSSALELDELLEIVHQQVSRIFETTNFFIATYQEGDDEWATIFHLEHGQRQPLARYSVERGLTGYILRTHRPLLLRSVQENVAFHQAQDIEHLGERAMSWMGVPLIAADKVVGVMAIQSYEQEYLYNQQDLTLFSTIAAQVANALDNLRLLAEARRRAQEVETINQVGRAITAVLDPGAVLRQIVDITKAHFGHYFVSIALVEGERVVLRDGSTIGASEDRLAPSQLSIDLSHDSSLIAEAVRTAQPVLSNDVLNDPRYFPIAELPDTRSELIVPLETKGRVIGALDVQSARPFAFDQDDVALFQSLASQASVAIENALLFEQTQSALTETQALYRAARSVTVFEDVSEMLQSVVDGVAEALPADRVVLYVLDLEEQQVIHCVQGGPSASQLDPVAYDELWEGLSGWVLRELKPALSPKGVPDSRESLEVQQRRRARQSGSIIVVPVRYRDKILGTITAINPLDGPDFAQRDVDLMMAMANQAAIALENARLFEQTQEALAESKALYQATQAISEPLELEVLIERLVEAACQLTSAQYGVVLTLDPATGSGGQAARIAHLKTYGVDLEGFPVHRLPTGKGLLGLVLSGQTVRSEDVGSHSAATGAPDWHFPIRSVLGVPLLHGDQVRGLVMVGEPLNRRVFSQRDERVLTSFATQAAIAIENRRLFEQAQARAAWESRLRAITDRIRRGTDTEAILRIGSEELSRVLSASQVIVRLGSQEQLLGGPPGPRPEADYIRPVAGTGQRSNDGRSRAEKGGRPSQKEAEHGPFHSTL